MSLLKRLLLSVSVAICVILGGMLWLGLDGVRSLLAVTAEDPQARAVVGRLAWQAVLLVVGAGVLWAIAVVLLIRRFGAALEREVSAQVRAIAGGESDAVPDTPAPGERIKELAQVHHVIESVRERVRATADEQGRQIESLTLELNSDEVTGVANRKYFLNELRRMLAEGGSSTGTGSAFGHVLVFRQRDLAAINTMHERQQADAWLRRVTDEVWRVIGVARDTERELPQLARLNGSDFIVLLAGYDGPDTTDLIEQLRRALNLMRIPTSEGRLCRWSYALTDYSPGCDVSRVLARLDQALMRAESAGHDEVEYLAAGDGRVATHGGTGETAWKRLIQEALAEDRLELTTVPALYRDDDITDRHEGYLMLRDAEGSGASISGYLFMPPAVRLGLSATCDLRGLGLALQWLRDHPGYLALRISLASIMQPGFLQSMEQVLQNGDATPQERGRLAIEVDAHGFVAYPDELKAFCELAAKVGVGVGVRRLAEQPAALLRLHRVSIRYIKLGGELISGLLESPGAIQLIAAITEAAIGQGVKIYAHDVPNSTTAALLIEYGVLLPVDEQFSFSVEETEGDFIDD